MKGTDLEKTSLEGTKREIWGLKSVTMLLSWLLMTFSVICVILVLGVLPLYSREGYTHMGTDKSYLLRTAAVGMGKLVLPVFGLWMMLRILQRILERRAERQAVRQTGGHVERWAERQAASQTEGYAERRMKPQAAHRTEGYAERRTEPHASRHMWRHIGQYISLTDGFACLFAVSSVLSWFCSHYRDTALWGTKGWYMGMLTQLTFVSIYFLLSRFEYKKIAEWLLYLCLPVSSAVFLLGLLNRFDIWPVPMENSGRPLYISTVGNINWYCSYAVTVLFVGIGLFWTDRGERKWKAALLGSYIFLGFATLITQGSESGIFALVLVLLVLFILSAFSQDAWKLRRFWQIMMLLGGAGAVIWMLRTFFPGQMNYSSRLGKLFYGPLAPVLIVAALAGVCLVQKLTQDSAQGFLHIQGWKFIQDMAKILIVLLPVGFGVFIVMIALNTLHHGILGGLSDKAVFTFNNKWGSSRGATWTIGIRCFMEQDFLHKFIGIGPDCMADFLYTDSSSELLEAVQQAFVNKRLTNAHCEILTILVNMGILGAISYAGMWFSLLKKLLFSGKDNLREHPVAAACGLGVLAYFLNNLWSFQQSVGAATVFAVMGLGAYFVKDFGNYSKRIK